MTMPVDPAAFVGAMRAKWAEYGNVDSPALRRLWRIICQRLNYQVHTPTAPRPVIPAELGAGKTLSAKMWCSLLPADAHPGVLVVVPRKDQASEFAEHVNLWAGRPTALALYSGMTPPPTRETLHATPVLVICHASYEIGLDRAFVEAAGRYEFLMTWAGGQRRLAIVDEALEHVAVARLTHEDLAEAERLVQPSLWPQHLLARAILRSARDAIVDAANTTIVPGAQAILARAGCTVEEAEAALRALGLAAPASDRGATLRRHLRTLCRHLVAYHWIDGEEHAMVGTRLLLPRGAGQMFFDATARVNALYRACQGVFHIESVPVVRDYRTVTLFVSRSNRSTGKTAMSKRGVAIHRKILTELRAAYGPALMAERSVLAVSSKDTQPGVLALWEAAGWGRLHPDRADDAPPLEALPHWGALEGSNAWHDFDTAVLTSLPYVNRSTDVARFLAYHNLEPDTAWHQQPEPAAVRDVRELHLVSEIGQAMGRIRLRGMVSEDGQCEPCHVWLRLPHSWPVRVDADRIVTELETVFPGIRVERWRGASEARSAAGRRPRGRQAMHEYLIGLAVTLEPGQRVALHRPASISHGTWMRGMAAARGEGLAQAALAALGVHLEPGRGAGRCGAIPAALVRSA